MSRRIVLADKMKSFHTASKSLFGGVCGLLLILALLGVPSAAQAQLINVLIDGATPDPIFTGQGVLTGATEPGGSVDWNLVLDSSTYSLNSSSGDPTGVTLSGAQIIGGAGGIGIPSPTSPTALLQFGALLQAPSTTLTLSGLADGAYNLVIYSEGGTPDPTTCSINGATAIDLPSGGNYTSFQLGNNYTLATATVSDGSMTMEIGGGDGVPYINGLQIQEVPEPSTWSMLAVGLVALVPLMRGRGKV
jgi:hypothetical protein